MQGLAEAIRYFYEQWILRDTLGYITLGAILVGTVVVQLVGWTKLAKSLEGLPFLAFVPLFGLLFIVGFALQNIGESVGLLSWHERRSEKKHLRTLYQFHKANSVPEEDPRAELSAWTERTRERMSTKKNMTGTASIALIICFVFTLAYQGLQLLDLKDTAEAWMTIGLLTLLLAFVGWGLLVGHRRQSRYQKEWEDISLKDADRA